MRRRLSIRTSLFILAIATALPFIAQNVYQGWADAATDVDAGGEEALRTAKVVAKETQHLLGRTQELLTSLSTRPLVRTLDRSRCDPIFPEFTELFPQYTNMLTVNRNADRICSAVAPSAGTPAKVDPKLYLTDTLARQAFTVGQVARGIFTGRWILIVAQPLQDDLDSVSGVLAISVDLAKLRLASDGATLPAAAVARVIDARGVVLASSHEHEKWVGQSVAGLPWFGRLNGQGEVFQTADADGVEKMFGVVPVENTRWHVVVTIPVDVLHASMWRNLNRTAAVTALALIMAALLAFWTARRTARPIEQIAAAVRESAHLLDAPAVSRLPGLAGAPREIQSLAADFDAMLKNRNAAEADLRGSEERFRQLTENIEEVFWLADPAKKTVLYVSPAYEAVWGRSRDALYASPREWIDAIHPDDREQVLEAGRTRLASGGYDQEYRIVRPDGSVRWVHDRAFPVAGPTGSIYRIAGVAQDVTARRESDNRIHHLSRMHAVLSGVNTLIVRERNRPALLREACQIAVNAGGFGVAWIGTVDHAAQKITPVAWSGDDQGHVELVRDRITFKVGRDQRLSLPAQAVQSGKPVVSNDIANDARIAYKKEHERFGTRSLACLPIIVGGQVVALFMLYSREVAFFDEEEMKLLRELAGDIAFAIDHIEKASRLDYIAFFDELTGLANRRLLHERLEKAIHGALEADEQLALILVDIDRFKTINDAYGRHAGDDLLRQFADRLVEAVGSERVARTGADRFAIILPHVHSEKDVMQAMQERRVALIERPFTVAGNELRCSAKAGITLFPADGDNAETLFANAEAAVKKAKEGGDRFLFYTQQMTARVAERLATESNLRRATNRGEFVLHYQPKVNVADRRITGMEALIRWLDPQKGLVPPFQFIHLLEETGLILEVGAWALRRAAEDHAHWQSLGLDAPRIAVNVSPIQLRQNDFLRTVERAIAGQNGNGGQPGIDLEITESLIMEDVAGNIEKLDAIRRLGMSIAIDDFGTGYSSLGYLAKLPVATIKIDRSFIDTMLQEPDTMTLVSTIISLAHSMRLQVVAEGVEKEEQAQKLRELRCDQMQGYLISKPLPRDELTGMLEAQARADAS